MLALVSRLSYCDAYSYRLLPNPNNAMRSLSIARTRMQLAIFERRAHILESLVCVHCALHKRSEERRESKNRKCL